MGPDKVLLKGILQEGVVSGVPMLCCTVLPRATYDTVELALM